MPTAIVQSTPLMCQPCKEDNCKFMKHWGTYNPLNKAADGTWIEEYNPYWATKYCTMEAVDEFVLYYPYVLILIPLVIVLIEKGFIR